MVTLSEQGTVQGPCAVWPHTHHDADARDSHHHHRKEEEDLGRMGRVS